jgi:hypothetical protein
MKDSEDLFKVFTGNEASAILLKAKLEEIGVSAMIKDDSINAFLGAAPVMTDLYIRKSDISRAIETINEFIKANTGI